MDRSPSRSHHSAKFGFQRHSSIEGIMFLVCHVMSQDQKAM